MGTDIIIHRLGTLYLRHEGGSRVPAEDIACKDDHELVSPEDMPLLVDHPYPVRIPVKGNPRVRLVLTDGLDQNSQILRYRWIRMMIGECSIRLRKELYHVTAHVSYDVR